MKNFKVAKNVYLMNGEIEIIPYLMVKEMELIINNMLQTSSLLEQQQILVANVLVCTTNLFDEDTDEKYVYEDIIYSGLWNEILEKCPYLKQNIETIWKEVNKRQNLEFKLCAMVDSATEILNQLSQDRSIPHKIKSFIEMITKEVREKIDGDSK